MHSCLCYSILLHLLSFSKDNDKSQTDHNSSQWQTNHYKLYNNDWCLNNNGHLNRSAIRRNAICLPAKFHYHVQYPLYYYIYLATWRYFLWALMCDCHHLIWWLLQLLTNSSHLLLAPCTSKIIIINYFVYYTNLQSNVVVLECLKPLYYHY